MALIKISWRVRLASGICAASIASFSSSPTAAWGNDGHKVVALVARHIIDKNPAVAAKIDALLAGPIVPDVGPGFADLGTWGDAYRQSHPATAQWHYIDLVVGDPEPVRDCFNNPALPAGTLASAGTGEDCVVGKINQFRKELADTTLSPGERKLALLFLLHFVGDVHQPLHDAERNKDRGGNEVPVVVGQNAWGTSLHGYWDTNVIHRLGSTPEAIAGVLNAELDQNIPADWVATASDARTLTWATDGYAIADNWAYAKLSDTTRTCRIAVRNKPPKIEPCHVISTTYAQDATGKARGQLERAGVRLAAVITEALQ